MNKKQFKWKNQTMLFLISQCITLFGFTAACTEEQLMCFNGINANMQSGLSEYNDFNNN